MPKITLSTEAFDLSSLKAADHLHVFSYPSLLKAKNTPTLLTPVLAPEDLAAIVASLDPSPLKCASNTHIRANKPKVSVHALPEVVCRSNSPARADALKGMFGSPPRSSLYILFIIPTHSHLSALLPALARELPRYSRASKYTNPSQPTIYVNAYDAGGAVEMPPLAIAASRAVWQAAEIVDTPPEDFNTEAFKKAAQEVAASATHVKLHIIEGKPLLDGGFGGLIGVGKQSTEAPKLIVLTRPGGPKSVAIVGKGIVYDTGGLSLKTKEGMPHMKADCGGAAACLAAFRELAVSHLVPELTVHCVMCVAENSIGPIAVRPDDIITMHSGKSVEINNPDAEGRLVLGDGVSYASGVLKADCIVDIATLTGAQGISTGKFVGAAVTDSAQLETDAVEAGKVSGDLMHPMPFLPELLFPEFASKVADMKNSVKDRSNAQVSCAGLFIHAHLHPEFKGEWMHCDIAKPAFLEDRATGFGTSFLLHLLQRIKSRAD